VHNVYTQVEPRGVFMGLVAGAMDLMRDHPSANGRETVFLGGDFNVGPRNRSARGKPDAHVRWSDVMRTLPAYAIPPSRRGTTFNGRNLHDDWYVSDKPEPNPVPVLNPRAWGLTMNNGLMSDHAAILISTA
jgi:hypothetical protein